MQSPPPDRIARNTALRAGFTLIELSIVLVIIGLVVGGVLVGHDLIKAAEIRSLIRQQEQFRTAVATFRGKYDCLPGDCTNADTAWGFSSGQNPATVPNDGNGDGIIGRPDGYLFTCCSTVPANEPINFWADLVEAGLITAPMPGYETGIPAGIRADTWWVGYSAHSGGWPGYATGPLGNVLALVGVPGQCGFNTCGGAKFSEGLTPDEAYKIDSKIDDGLPNSGSVQASSSGNWIDPDALSTDGGWTSPPNECVNGSDGSTASPYAPANTNNLTRCNLLFKLGL